MTFVRPSVQNTKDQADAPSSKQHEYHYHCFELIWFCLALGSQNLETRCAESGPGPVNPDVMCCSSSPRTMKAPAASSLPHSSASLILLHYCAAGGQFSLDH